MKKQEADGNNISVNFLCSDIKNISLEDGDNIDPEYEECFGVIAVSSDGSSYISNLFHSNELAHMLPNSPACNSNQETVGISCAGTANLALSNR